MKTLIEISIKGETLSLDLALVPSNSLESITAGLLGIGLKNTLQDASAAKGDASQNRKNRLEKLLLGTYVFKTGGSRGTISLEDRAYLEATLHTASAFDFAATGKKPATKKSATAWLAKRDPKSALFAQFEQIKRDRDNNPDHALTEAEFAQAKKVYSFDQQYNLQLIEIPKQDAAAKEKARLAAEAQKASNAIITTPLSDSDLGF